MVVVGGGGGGGGGGGSGGGGGRVFSAVRCTSLHLTAPQAPQFSGFLGFKYVFLYYWWKPYY